MKLALLLALALPLSGCATYSQDRSRIDATIATLVGQPVSAAMDRFGVPSRTSPAGTSTIYVWANENVLYPGLDEPLSCQVRLIVSGAGLVERGEHDGNNYACSQLADRIR